MASTYIPCLTVSIIMIISALPLLISGFIIGNRYKRVLNVNQSFFFWIGRDRVVFDVGKNCKVVGIILLGLGIIGLWLGLSIVSY